MPNRVQNKRSSTENNRPDAGDLLAGEIAINTNAASANVHFEDASGNVRNVGADPLAAAAVAQYVRQVDADGVGTWVEQAVEINLGYTAAADTGTITNTAGDDATIPLADDTNAGLFTAAEKSKLDGIEAGAQVNDSYDKTESDDRYLRVDADAPEQTRVAGQATFAELTDHEGGVSLGTQNTQPAPQSDATVTYYGDDLSRSFSDCYGNNVFRLKSDASTSAMSYLFEKTNSSDKIATCHIKPTGYIRINKYNDFVPGDTAENDADYKCELGKNVLKFALKGRDIYSNTQSVSFGLLESDESAIIGAASDLYRFSSTQYGSTLNLRTNSNVFGMDTAVTTSNGQYGIHHSQGITISLKNKNGEARLNKDGTFTASTFFLASWLDIDNPDYYDDDGTYIGPKFDLREKIETLQQEKQQLLETVDDLVARVEALEAAAAGGTKPTRKRKS